MTFHVEDRVRLCKQVGPYDTGSNGTVRRVTPDSMPEFVFVQFDGEEPGVTLGLVTDSLELLHRGKCWRCPYPNAYGAPDNCAEGFECGGCRVTRAMMRGEKK